MNMSKSSWRIDLLPDGTVRSLHQDHIARILAQLGSLQMTRLTDIVWEDRCQQWVPYAQVPLLLARGKVPPGDTLAPGTCTRTEALAAEVAVLQSTPQSYGRLLHAS